MNALINIDNGGTLTDVCLWDGDGFTFAKTLTTPHDLSECLFDGIEKVSAARFGRADVTRLLHHTKHIRYSTTQGTNALVEQRGPMIGLLTAMADLASEMQGSERERDMFANLIDDRIATIDLSADDVSVEFEVVQLVNQLATQGAARVVVACASASDEQRLRTVLLQKFPRHLLGSIPTIYSWELAGDRNDARRVWSSVINAFLHPTMERFLYGAERRLKEYRITNPLLVYRNDGASSRVAKSVALKTYSSGPRGGLEGTAALARVYRIDHTLMMDIGGTTTDVGVVSDGTVAVDQRGTIRGVPISYSMSDVHSKGVGGSSVIAVRHGAITVGPESVGAAPGPACFGFGGKQATITDVNLLLGVLDADTYLDGTFRLDAERSRTVIVETVAEPLGISLEEALIRMEAAYFEAVADAFAHLVRDDTVLSAFGGAGPMSATGAARAAGVKRVLIPRTAAVFSAVGISFSDVGKTYEVHLEPASTESATEAFDQLLARAARDMFQEGYQLADCEQEWSLLFEGPNADDVATQRYRPGDAIEIDGRSVSLRLSVTARLSHPVLHPDKRSVASVASVAGTRRLRTGADHVEEVRVYNLDDLEPGAEGKGPAVIEGPFFTARIQPSWEFRVTSAGDLILDDTH